MKSKDAQKKTPRNRPKPFIPDFMKQPAKSSPINNEAVVQDTVAIDDVLNMPRG